MQATSVNASACNEEKVLLEILQPLTVNIDSWSVPKDMPIVRIDDAKEFYRLAMTAWREKRQIVLNEHGLLILFYNNVCYVYYSNGGDGLEFKRRLKRFIHDLNSEEFRQKDDKLFRLVVKLNDLAHELLEDGHRYCHVNGLAELWFDELMQLPLDVVLTVP